MRIGVVTLGCDKNTVDAEYIAGWLQKSGAEVARGDLEDAALNAVVILTCGFIEAAVKESAGAINDWLDVKEERGPAFVVAVAGCLSQARAEELRAGFPGIDLIAGVGEFEALARAIYERIEREQRRQASGEIQGAPAAGIPIVLRSGAPDAHIEAPAPRASLAPSATAYLKIADGCDYACAFCAIPQMKGRYRSVRPEILLEEARGLVERGAREIILVAQDVSVYGTDLGADYRLPHLLRDLCATPGDFWLRVLYFYPGGFSDEMIEVIATEPKICPYLDIPLQHLDPAVIAAMRRPYSEVKVLEWIERLRARIPDVALRTTFIAGFPGEGKKEFMRLLNGLRTIRFDNVGFFPFSPQENTPAAAMPHQVSESVKTERCERLARRQQQIAEELGRRFMGKRIEVLVDGRFEGTDLYIGHSRWQAPEIDGMTRFVSRAALEPGAVVTVEITRAEGFDLVGEAVGHSRIPDESI